MPIRLVDQATLRIAQRFSAGKTAPTENKVPPGTKALPLPSLAGLFPSRAHQPSTEVLGYCRCHALYFGDQPDRHALLPSLGGYLSLVTSAPTKDGGATAGGDVGNGEVDCGVFGNGHGAPCEHSLVSLAQGNVEVKANE